MCGIAGIAGKGNLSDQEELVGRMCEALRHRGPDDQGLYAVAGCVLGQARLSIIDLGGGHQPLANEDGTIWITFNGEIYNYIELRADLISRGHQFKTTTDTEVIVHLYEEKGIGLLQDLNGMFAFALWDSNNRALFIARDRLGIKPVYYSTDAHTLTFASELKALLLNPRLPRTIDREALAQYMTLIYIPEPRTPFANVKKLRSGSFIQYKDGCLQESTYWRVPTVNETQPRSVDDLCDEIRELILNSVRLQLRADVPVGLFASGGIDSTAIMWAASRSHVALDAFLVEFDELAADTPYARMAAAQTDMRLTEHHLDFAEAGKLLPRLIWHLDEPLADSAIIPCYLVAKEAAKHVKVILNGTGGDELFGGYPRYGTTSGFPGTWPSPVEDLFSIVSIMHPFFHRAIGMLDHRHRYFRRISIFQEDVVRRLLGLRGPGESGQTVRKLFRQSEPNDRAGSMMFVDLNLYLPGDLFMMLDKTTMAVSLEARVPLLDHRLVEFMARLPGYLKMQDGQLKWLLREALRPHISSEILDRPKQGFGPPIQKWMNGPLGKASLKLVQGSKSRVLNLFGEKPVAAWTNSSRGLNGIKAGQIWTILNLELWWRMFVDQEDIRYASIQELADAEGCRWT